MDGKKGSGKFNSCYPESFFRKVEHEEVKLLSAKQQAIKKIMKMKIIVTIKNKFIS
ncbi:MAG: hypothetical protein GY714_10440 [Desulfobacterales bacterium]|nr:hypothetical protein [Desulfobacterales bacterium]